MPHVIWRQFIEWLEDRNTCVVDPGEVLQLEVMLVMDLEDVFQ